MAKDIASIIIEKMAPSQEVENEMSDAEIMMNKKQVLASDIISAIKKADARMLASAFSAFYECLEAEEEKLEEQE